jgi:RimJ/RimL family protein N-acetyltransferase
VVRLREVEEDDLPILFEHQLDEESNRMAAFPARDRHAFMTHWATILEDPTVLARTIELDGDVVGNVVSWEGPGVRLVGYWVTRQRWGRGIATAGLTAFLEVDRSRPIHALVAAHNAGSIRVLEKCGFARSDEDVSTGDGVEEVLFRRDA